MNKMMKAAAVLAILTMLTTGFVGGTFAKYATGANGSDNARVAKFGVAIAAENSGFGKSYKSEDGKVSTTYNASTDSVNATENVIAPGTGDTISSITITGTPEVKVKVTYSAEIVLGDKWLDEAGAYYCPLVFTVGTDTIKGLDYTSADAFAAAVAEKISSFVKTYEAGTDLSSSDKLSVSWKWPYESGKDASDTYLGDQAAAGEAATIRVDISAEVVQVD